MQKIGKVIATIFVVWIGIIFLRSLSLHDNTVHLRAKPSDDGQVRVWKVPGSVKPVYKMVRQEAQCIRMDNYEHYPIHLVRSYYYIHVRCDDVYGFVSNYDVVELHP